MISFSTINNVIGVAELDSGYRLDFSDGSSRLATDAEILAAKKLVKIDELKTACQNHITAGYTSDALGSTHSYDSDLNKDQSNIIGSIIAGVPLEMTCTDSNGVKAMRLHTVQQIQQVFADGMMKLQAAKARYYALKAQVDAAIDIATVDAIVWTESW